MAWIESHQELRDHPKTRRLARILGIHVAQAIGHLHMLWWWALDYAPDGDLTDYDAHDIAEAGGWDGDPEAFVDALLQCGPGASFGFLERTPEGRLVLHDWDDYNNEHKVRQAAAERKRRSRQRRMASGGHSDVTGQSRDMTVTAPTESRDGHADVTGQSRDRGVTVTGQSRDGHADVTLDRTGQDQTGQEKDDDDARAREESARGAVPERERADGAVPLGPRIGPDVIEPPEELRPIAEAYFAATGRPLAPGKDLQQVREALKIATVDQIVRAIQRGAERYRPAYEGDKIRGFGYFLPIVREIVAEDESLIGVAAAAKAARASPQRMATRDLSFLDEGA